MDLTEYIKLIRRRWAWLIATILLTVAAIAIYTFTVTPQYESSARLFITTSPSDTSDAYQGALFSVQRVTSYADLVSNSRQLAQTVVDDLNLSISAADLLNKVSTQVDTDTVVLQVTIRDPHPALAQSIAKAYSQNLTTLVQTLETPPGQTVPPIKATIVDSATLPTLPVSPRPLRNLLLALIAGIVLGGFAAVVREKFDSSIRVPADFVEFLDTPVLGAIAFDQEVRSSPLITDLPPHAPRVEAFRVLRTNLQFVDVDAVAKVFVITSGLPEEGKTSTAVNLSLTLAQSGSRTLLIEGDLRPAPRRTHHSESTGHWG